MGISVLRGVECKYVEIVSEVAPDGRKAGGKWAWSKRGKMAEMAEMGKMAEMAEMAEMGKFGRNG